MGIFSDLLKADFCLIDFFQLNPVYMGSVETSVPCFETSHFCLLLFMCV